MELLSKRDTKIVLKKLLKYRQMLENIENPNDAREMLSIEILEDIEKLLEVKYDTNDIELNRLLAKNKQKEATFEDVWKEALKIINTKED